MHNFPRNVPIILASGSPRRQELLTSIGVEFSIIKPDVDEEGFDVAHLTPYQLVEFLAEKKAGSVANSHPQAFVIGSDTVVSLENQVLGKPHDEAEAFTMLRQLQGNCHHVISGISVCYNGQCISSHAVTEVTMDPMNDELIRQYIATGEPMDKAGAYAIQGYTSLFIPRINGCYFNVVGMSLNLLNRLVRQVKIA